MSDFEKYKHMKIEGVQEELRMLVADDNKGTKKIVWHGPEVIKREAIKTSDLFIKGMLTYAQTDSTGTSSAASCQFAISENGAPYAVNNGVTPPIIIYEPTSCFTSQTAYAKDNNVFCSMPLSNGNSVGFYETSPSYFYKDRNKGGSIQYTRWHLNSNGTWETVSNLSDSNSYLYYYAGFSIDSGFAIVGDKSNVTVSNSFGGGAVSCLNIGTPVVLYDPTSKKLIYATSSGTLPGKNNDILAIVKIGRNCSEFFKHKYKLTSDGTPIVNNAWHFHIGNYIKGSTNSEFNSGWTLPTYGLHYHQKYTDGGSLPISNIQNANYSTGKTWTFYVKPDGDTITTKYTDFVPVEETWYELYIDSPSNILTYYNETGLNHYLHSFIRIRKASLENIDKWCPKTKTDGIAKVKYTPDSIKYNFYILNEKNEILNNLTESLNHYTSKGTIIETSLEAYNTSPEATTALRSSYNYSPTVPLVLDSSKSSIDPDVFSNNFPINTVYYSGNKFIEVPEKIYGTTLMNESGGLIINGIMTPADNGDSCMTAVASNNALYATCSSDQPAIIEFDPQIVYAKNTSYAKDSNVLQSYKTTSGSTVNLYEANEASYFKNYSVNGTWHNTGTYVKDILTGIEIKGGSDQNWKGMNLMSAVGVNFGFEITGNTLIPTVGEVGQACNHLTGSSLFTLTSNSSSDKYIFTYNTDKGTLPDGNVFALIRIKSSANPLFKKLYQMKAANGSYGAEICNNGWHFHLGDFGLFGNGGICFPTYGKTCYSNYLPEWNGGAVKPGTVTSACFVWPEDATTFADVQNFIPEVDTWYELYIDPNCPKTTNYYDLRLVRCRKASEEHRRKWLANDNAVVTNGDIKVNNNKLNYEFKINAPGFTDQNIITLTGPEAISKGTLIDWHSEYYLTNIIPQDSSYYFYPTLKLINSIDLSAENPEVFTESNPINVVYYSGCTFKSGEIKKTIPTVNGLKEDLPQVSLTWDGPDYAMYGDQHVLDLYPACSTTNKKWPLRIAYLPSTVTLMTTSLPSDGRNWWNKADDLKYSCWYLNGSSNPLTLLSQNNGFYSSLVALVDFKDSVVKLAEQQARSLTTSVNMALFVYLWHYHFVDCFKLPDGKSITTGSPFLTTHPYQSVGTKNTREYPIADCNLFLSITDSKGNKKLTPVWSARPNYTYSLYYMHNENDDSNYYCNKVKASLKTDPTTWPLLLKLYKDVSPYVQYDHYSKNWNIAWEVAKEIWDFSSYNIPEQSTHSSLSNGVTEYSVSNLKVKFAENPSFNTTRILNWWDSGTNIENSHWYGWNESNNISSYYEMLSILFTPNKVIHTDFNGSDFMYAEQLSGEPAEIASVEQFGKGIYSTIIIDDVPITTLYSSSLVTNAKCINNDNSVEPNIEILKLGNSLIEDEVIIFSNNIYVLDSSNLKVSTLGCIHKILDSNINIYTEGASIVSNRSSLSYAFYGYINTTKKKIEYYKCEKTDSWAWKYTTVKHES